MVNSAMYLDTCWILWFISFLGVNGQSDEICDSGCDKPVQTKSSHAEHCGATSKSAQSQAVTVHMDLKFTVGF